MFRITALVSLLALTPNAALGQIRSGSDLYLMLSNSAAQSSRNFAAAGRHTEAQAWNAWANHYMIWAMATMPDISAVQIARDNYSMAQQNAAAAARYGMPAHASFYRAYAGFWLRIDGWLRGANPIPTLPLEMTVALREAPMTPWYTPPSTGLRPGTAAYEACMEEKRQRAREGRLTSSIMLTC